MKIRAKKFLCFLVSLLLLFTLISNVQADSQDVRGLSNGTSYYLRNNGNSKYLRGVTPAMVNLSLSSFSSANNYRWILERTNNGLYVIKSKQNSNLVLTVSGSNVILSSRNNNNTNQAFTITRITTGVRAGTYQIKIGTNYVVRSSNSIVLSQLGSHYNACWSFETCYQGLADMFYFVYPGFNTSGAANTFSTSMTSLGFSTNATQNKSAYSGYINLQADSVFLYHGHGECSQLVFTNSTGGYTGWIKATSADINPYNSSNEYAVGSLSNNSLCKAKCVLYVGCCTGCSSNGHNLVQETFNKGAHFVLGTKRVIYIKEANAWIKSFFSGVKGGATIQYCLRYACTNISMNDLYCIGDVFQKIG